MKTETETTDQTKISQQLSLYYIEEALIGLIEAREMAETDEERAVCDEQMRLYVTAEVLKGSGIISYLRNAEALAAAAFAEAEKLTKVGRVWRGRHDRVLSATLAAMQTFGQRRIDCGLGSLLIKSNPPSVEILDAALVPDKYKRQTISVDIQKGPIKADIAAGLEVPGVRLVTDKVRLEVR